MKKLLTLALLSCSLTACGDSAYPTTSYVCSAPEDKQALAAWVSKCIAEANPQSDEEPEDWIRECARVGPELVCPLQRAVRYLGGANWTSISCKDAVQEHHVKLCKEG